MLTRQSPPQRLVHRTVSVTVCTVFSVHTVPTHFTLSAYTCLEGISPRSLQIVLVSLGNNVYLRLEAQEQAPAHQFTNISRDAPSVYNDITCMLRLQSSLSASGNSVLISYCLLYCLRSAQYFTQSA